MIRNTSKEMDGNPWRQSRVRRLLTNVVYKGDYYSHATICLVPGKQVRNNGVRDRIYITEHHELIVCPELFDWVQMVIKRKLLFPYKRLSKEDAEFLKGGAHFAENSNEN